MQIDDILHDVQADTGARLVVHRLEERLEDTLAVFLANADAIVADHDAEVHPVRLRPATEPHVVPRVFIGIRQQVADHLRHGFLVDDGREVLVWTVHRKPFAALLESRCKAFAHTLYKFMDVVRRKPHHQTLLLHLAEVEQLVHQFQQPVGIAVDDAHVGLTRDGGVGLHDFLQRTDNQRHRRTYLVGNHREEVQTRLAHLLLLLRI